MMRSISSAVLPARSSACSAARSARSEVAQSSGAYQRERIPLEASILSTNSGAVAAKRWRSMSFVLSTGGTNEPVETRLAYPLSPKNESPIHREHRAADELRGVAGQPGVRVRDVH